MDVFFFFLVSVVTYLFAHIDVVVLLVLCVFQVRLECSYSLLYNTYLFGEFALDLDCLCSLVCSKDVRHVIKIYIHTHSGYPAAKLENSFSES